MLNDIISVDEAKEIAAEWIRQTEQKYNVEINGMLSTTEEILVYEMQGKVKTTVNIMDVTTGMVINHVLAERCFELKISAKEGEVLGYVPRDWTNKSDEGSELDREMKESEIAKNQAVIEHLERMDKQREGRDFNQGSVNELGIDLGRLGVDLDDFQL